MRASPNIPQIRVMVAKDLRRRVLIFETFGLYATGIAKLKLIKA